MFSQFGNEKAVRPMLVGSQSQHAAWHLYVAVEKRLGRKFGVACQETCHIFLIFFGEDGAGGVDENAAVLDITAVIFQNGQLDIGQSGAVGGILIADLRFFGNDTEAGAGNIAQHPVSSLKVGVVPSVSTQPTDSLAFYTLQTLEGCLFTG